MACGFSIDNQEKLNLFREKLLALAVERLTPEVLAPKLKLEAALALSEINLDLVEAINGLAPFGQNNPQPRFVSFGLRLEDIALMGSERQHIKLRVAGTGQNISFSLWAISFGNAASFQELKPGQIIDLAYYLDINEFHGRREVQLKIIDWRLSEQL